MERYYDPEFTPLRFHNLNKFVIVPLNVLFMLLQLIDVLRAGNVAGLAAQVQVSYYALSVCLATVAFVGFVRWRPYGPLSFLIYAFLTLAFDVFTLVQYILYAPAQVAAGITTVIGSIIFGILVLIYYRKRWPLFSNMGRRA